VKRHILATATALALAFAAPAFAQRSHPGGGPPAGHAPGGGSSMGASHATTGGTHADISHGTPSDVLSHNTAVAGKIKSLTGQDAQTACSGF